MLKQKYLRLSLFVILLLGIPFSITYINKSYFNVYANDADSNSTFLVQTDNLKKIDKYLTANKDNTHSFNKELAIKDRLSSKSIILMDQINNFSNDLLRSGIISDYKVNINKYPEVKTYFNQAYQYVKSNKEFILSNSSITPQSSGSRYVCGYYDMPRPLDGKDHKDWSFPGKKAEDVLKSWGYHAPPSWKQDIAWTRGKTWQIAKNTCHENSYRDNAKPSDKNTEKLWEQNYGNADPPGEPNPEVWAYSWPYGDWPAYVYWWHTWWDV